MPTISPISIHDVSGSPVHDPEPTVPPLPPLRGTPCLDAVDLDAKQNVLNNVSGFSSCRHPTLELIIAHWWGPSTRGFISTIGLVHINPKRENNSGGWAYVLSPMLLLGRHSDKYMPLTSLNSFDTRVLLMVHMFGP